MRITDFEKNFLGIDGGNDEFNPYVIRLFHTLLQKVERDPYRKWTHDLLRNYVNASYCFCCNLNDSRKAKIASQDANAIRKDKIASQEAKSKEQKEQEKQEEKNESPQVNLYEDYDTNLKVFFTGLYTPGTYQGLKNGLYFVINPSINPSVEPKISVKTRKEIFEADQKEMVLLKFWYIYVSKFEETFICKREIDALPPIIRFAVFILLTEPSRIPLFNLLAIELLMAE